jgi:hypothetical protein
MMHVMLGLFYTGNIEGNIYSLFASSVGKTAKGELVSNKGKLAFWR